MASCRISHREFTERCAQLLDVLLASEKPHLSEFAEAWAPDLDQNAPEAVN